MRRRPFLAGISAAMLAPAVGVGAEMTPRLDRAAQAIRAEFLHAWNGYKLVAWGRDEVRPVSGTARDFFIPGQSFGLSIVEALDTLYVMGLDDDLARCTRWIVDNLTFDV